MTDCGCNSSGSNASMYVMIIVIILLLLFFACWYIFVSGRLDRNRVNTKELDKKL